MAEITKTLTTRRKKKKAEAHPEYSVAIPPPAPGPLGHVERRPVRLGDRGDEEDQQAQRLLPDVPVEERARLLLHDRVEAHRPARMMTPTTDRVSGIS